VDWDVIEIEEDIQKVHTMVLSSKEGHRIHGFEEDQRMRLMI